MNKSRQRLEIHVSLSENFQPVCPVCRNVNVEIMKQETKEFRFAPVLRYPTYFIVEESWVNCPQHGLQKSEMPWERSLSGFMQGAKIF